MKISRLETHDRLEHFIEDQSTTIFRGAEDCLRVNPLSLRMQDISPYIYIFAHPRTHDDGLTKRMLWQPRFTKPTAQENSYLFRAQSHTDLIEICWLLPPSEMWDQYGKDKVCGSDIVSWSITMLRTRKDELEKPDPRDLSDEKVKEALLQLCRENMRTTAMKVEAFDNLWLPSYQAI